jgi:tRNA (guanine-N7-)-methyltransferase
MAVAQDEPSGMSGGPAPADPPELRPILLPWRRVAHPVDWVAEFGREAPLHLEIGFGDGRYTAARARAAPDHDHVGLEVSGTSVLRALRRLRREGIGNVRILKAPAEIGMRELFAPASLASITVNFPDPWPKERHARHRLLRVPFFRLASTRLLPGGEIRLASDHLDYVAFAREEAARSGVATRVERPAPPEVFETKYALKWRAQGKPLYYQVFALDGAGLPAPEPLGRHVTMPHALLDGGWPSDAPFEKLVVAAPEGHVIVHEAARAVGESDRWWFRVTVDEPELVQRLLVVAQRRAGGEVIVRLESFGDPLITPTVRAAIGVVTDWLESSGGMRATARNY